MDNIYLMTEQHPSGHWFYIVEDGTGPDGDDTLLDMNGPYPSKLEANNSGEHSLNRNIQSAG